MDGRVPERTSGERIYIMKNKIVFVHSIKVPIHESPGFDKKLLSEFHLELLALCGFGCRYCSSNSGNYLRINRRAFLELTKQQIGEAALPSEDPSLMFVWDADVIELLGKQLGERKTDWGNGKTIVVSMLTDAFSPWLLDNGVTRAALELLVGMTKFRIRILTKSAVVGTAQWIEFFAAHTDRFVVGLSTGTLDAKWAAQIELGTPSPEERLTALTALQNAGIPTYGMLCPVFPDLLDGGGVETLLDRIRPDRCEHVWAEPYNDRDNWNVVRKGYAPNSAGYAFLTDVYEKGDDALWSRYATDLYLRLRARAEHDGWLDKLRYLLYEGLIVEKDAARLGDMRGILLQSKPGKDGLSQNPHIRVLQQKQQHEAVAAAVAHA
jgi:DNA repair photolyase